jgi:hypothetical protein
LARMPCSRRNRGRRDDDRTIVHASATEQRRRGASGFSVRRDSAGCSSDVIPHLRDAKHCPRGGPLSRTLPRVAARRPPMPRAASRALAAATGAPVAAASARLARPRRKALRAPRR